MSVAMIVLVVGVVLVGVLVGSVFGRAAKIGDVQLQRARVQLRSEVKAERRGLTGEHPLSGEQDDEIRRFGGGAA